METQETRTIIELDREAVAHNRILSHVWMTPAGPGRCLATWQQCEDGHLHAECMHFLYIVKEP